MEIIATITQHELIFEPDQSLIGYQWSENLGIKVVYDGTYEGWSLKWDAITSGHKNKRIPLAYDEASNTIILNKDCFTDDYLYIACAFISGEQVRNSAPIEFYIGESVNHGLETMPKVPGLYEEMQSLFEQIFANEYKQPMDDLIERASDLERKTEELQTKAEAQQTQVDKAITEAGIAADNANVKAEEANTAAQAATDLVSDITAKLEAGEFKGEKGDTGATGEKGDKGDKGDTLPPGVIHEYAGSEAPAGYLFCQGQEISRTTYADLFLVIGTTYGSGDGETTFALPDMRGRVPVGLHVDDTDFDVLGKQGGSKTHILSVDEMPSHTHVQNAHKHSASGSSAEAGSHGHSASSNSTGAHTHTVTATAASGGSHAHNTWKVWSTKYAYGTYDIIMTGAPADGRGNPTESAGAHTHTVSGNAASAGGHSHTITVTSNGTHTHAVSVTVSEATATNQNTGGGLAHNNMQPYLVLNYIIKY